MFHQIITFTVPREVPDYLIDQYLNTKMGEFLSTPVNSHPRPLPDRGFDKIIYVSRRTLIGVYRSNTAYSPNLAERQVFEGKDPTPKVVKKAKVKSKGASNVR